MGKINIFLNNLFGLNKENQTKKEHPVEISVEVNVPNNKNISSDQISQIFSSSIGECEKYYPAFQFLLWEKKSPKDAIAASMLNTLGEA